MTVDVFWECLDKTGFVKPTV